MKTYLRILLCLTAVLALCLAPSVSASDAAPSAIVSPALTVLATRHDMAKTALVGDNIGFDAEDFERAMNLSYVDAVTFTRLPDPSAGELRLGAAALAQNQSVSGANLSLLTFVPAGDGVSDGSFDFSVGDSQYSLTCHLYFLEEVNYSPTISLTSENALTLHTHHAITTGGKLEAYDPEGDRFVYEIVSYPQNGAVVLTDRDAGTYLYTPASSYTGKDSFSYVARDLYGNYSAAATVSVSVKEPTTSVTFGDITDGSLYNAALTMAETSLMTGTDIQGVIYFNPEQEITRAEFLATAMKAAGMTDPGTSVTTVFADDADIPVSLKGYVNTAYELGFISGSELDGQTCFLPSTPVTRAEAAVMLHNILASRRTVDLPLVLPVFADSGDLPAWASDAFYCMRSLNILSDKDGYASPEATVSRGEAAQMFEAMLFLDA